MAQLDDALLALVGGLGRVHLDEALHGPGVVLRLHAEHGEEVEAREAEAVALGGEGLEGLGRAAPALLGWEVRPPGEPLGVDVLDVRRELTVGPAGLREVGLEVPPVVQLGGDVQVPAERLAVARGVLLQELAQVRGGRSRSSAAGRARRTGTRARRGAAGSGRSPCPPAGRRRGRTRWASPGGGTGSPRQRSAARAPGRSRGLRGSRTASPPRRGSRWRCGAAPIPGPAWPRWRRRRARPRRGQASHRDQREQRRCRAEPDRPAPLRRSAAPPGAGAERPRRCAATSGRRSDPLRSRLGRSPASPSGRRGGLASSPPCSTAWASVDEMS